MTEKNGALDQKKCCSSHRGRPRCASAHSKILEAAYEQLVLRGWDGFTFEGVASTAGVSKATIYRWWPDRHRLAVDSFVSQACDADKVPDTGCLYGDLESQIMKLVGLMTGKQASAVRAVFVAVQEKPELLEVLEQHWGPIRKTAMEKVVDQAICRGQLPSDVDADRMFQMVFGPVLMNVLLGKSLTYEELRPMVLQVLVSFGFQPEAARV